MNNLTSLNSSRVSSIDLNRGAVMILMAIDHVRVFAGIPAGGPTFGIFFTPEPPHGGLGHSTLFGQLLW